VSALRHIYIQLIDSSTTTKLCHVDAYQQLGRKIVRNASHAVSQRSSSASSQQAGQQLTKMRQSLPVQGIKLLSYSDTDRTLSPSSDKFLSSSSTDTSGASALPYAGLHSPLEECTVLSTWCIVRRASLPIDTFCLASLILKELGPSFYQQWSIEMNVLCRSRHRDRTRELIIVAGCVCSLNAAIRVLTFR